MRHVVLLLVTFVAACRPAIDPACVSMCEHHNDACVLHASDATELQRCDRDLTDCVRLCR
ncbi:MAG: hypothetical protein KF729_06440 [Sandaracinaceae bacterium]|nr:hypothetical protein [Sandaracinaceae bacterium]